MTAAQGTPELCVLMRGVTGHQQLPNWALPPPKLTCLPDPLTSGTASRGTGLPPSRCFLAMVLNTVINGAADDRGDVGPLEHQGDLELARRDLVVPRLGRDAELEQLALGVHHDPAPVRAPRRSGGRRTPWPFRRLGAEQRASGVDQVRRARKVPVDEEVLLLGPAERNDLRQIGVTEQLQDPLGMGPWPAGCRSKAVLIVQRLTGHRHEHGRDAQRVAVRVLQDVGRAGDVPAGGSRAPRRCCAGRRTEAGASGSPWMRVLPANSAGVWPSEMGSRKLS